MVFLVEGPLGKHVGMSVDHSSYELLTQGESWHLYPTISSNGESVAYATGTGPKDLVLVTKNLKTRAIQTLTQPGFILQPMFAQNGKRLFFSQKVGEINKIGYIDLATPSKIHYITDTTSSYFPAPFQSGEMVVYQKNLPNRKREIVLLDILSGEMEVIGSGMAPALSKDERYIAFTSKVEDNWDIYLYDRLDKSTKRMTTDLNNDFSPAFDRHGNLVYTSDRLENGVFSIFTQKSSAWMNGKLEESVMITKMGTSFYAPRITGVTGYKTTQMPKMTGEARSSFGTINHQGNVYVVGGHQGAEHTYPPESFTGRMTAYNLATKTWKDLAERPHKAHGYQLAAEGKYLYAFGGFAYEGSTNPKWKSLGNVERYNIETNKWEEIGPMPRRRSSNVVIKLGSKVYLFGGWDATPMSDGDKNGTFHDEVDIFDLKSHKWTTLAVKLPKKRRAFSGFEREGKIYLVGGISEGGDHFTLSDDFTQFDPTTNTFKEFPKLPYGNFAPATSSIGDQAFMFGGMFKTGEFAYEYVPHIYHFDFNLMTWSHTGRYLNEYKGFSQVVKIDSCLGILGGHSYQGGRDKPVDTFEVFCSK